MLSLSLALSNLAQLSQFRLFMIPEASSTTARHRFAGGDLPLDTSRATCFSCGQNLAPCPSAVPRVCERCLFGLALEPVGLAPVLIGEETTEWSPDAPLLGAYSLIEEIGRGGQGIIYRAIHGETRRTVAIKTVLPEDAGSSEALERFRREALAAQSLDHPYSMPIYEIGTSAEGLPFFSMKLASGGSLHHLKAKYRGRWHQIAELLVKVAKAVHHAHRQGIVHRDLKPGNILFTEDQEPLVTDFGLVKHLTGSDDLTRSCAVLGTPNYVSPEQASGNTRGVTAATDIYSLGAILFELLTDRPPFVGENPLDVLRQVAEQSPLKPTRYAPLVPKPLEAICMRCLRRRPEDRYESAKDLESDLVRWLEGKKIRSQPMRVRLRNFAKRVAGRARLIVLLAAVVVFGLIWVLLPSRQRSPAQSISIAVAMENLDQDSMFDPLLRQINAELKHGFLENRIFRLQDEETDSLHSLAEGFDPLNYGRVSGSQMVLAGSIRRSGEQAHLTARLLRSSTGEVIWRDSRNIDFKNTGATLLGLGKTVAEAIQAKLQSAANQLPRSTSNVPLPEAQMFYTRAMELSARDNVHDLEDAVALFRRAADTDARFAAARAMLAFTLWTQADTYGQSDKLPLAVAAAQQALGVDPNCAQAHRVMASCYFKTSRNDEALEEFWNAVEINPQSAGCCVSLGMCLRAMGRLDQAIHWMTRAVHLEPARSSLNSILGETYALSRLDAQAESALKRAIDLDADQPDPEFDLGALRLWQGRFEEARSLCAQTCLRFPENRFGSTLAGWIELCDGKTLAAEAVFKTLRAENSYSRNWKFYGAINPSSALAYLAMQTGAIEQARSFAQEALALDREIMAQYPKNPRLLHDMAATHAILGDADQALSFLSDAVAAGWIEARSTRMDPRFSAIADDPRFKRLISDLVTAFH